jgi:hypothetical protein
MPKESGLAKGRLPYQTCFCRTKSLVQFSMKSKEDRNYSDSVNTKSALRLGSSNFAIEKMLQLSLNGFFLAN